VNGAENDIVVGEILGCRRPTTFIVFRSINHKTDVHHASQQLPDYLLFGEQYFQTKPEQKQWEKRDMNENRDDINRSNSVFQV